MGTSSRAPSREAAAACALAALLATAPRARAQAVQGGALPGPLPLFPADNWWNADVSAAPVDPNSANFIAHIGGTTPVHPDFGGDVSPGSTAIYGMPYVVVPGDEPLEQIASFTYPTQSDTGAPGRPPGYPIPVEAKTQPHWIEGGYPGNANPSGDKHMLIVDKDHRLLFELWNTRCLPSGSPSCAWSAGSGAIFSLDSDHRRPDGWTSADAAGLAILPGLVRYDEAYGSVAIRHAFRVTVGNSNGYVYPASHRAGSTTGALPMGARLRLKSTKSVTSGDAAVQRIVQAMKTYGLVVADNGSNMYVQGTYDTRWDNGVLNPALGQLHASDFEVLQLGWQPPAVAASTAPMRLTPVAPCRVLDTRNAPGSFGAPALWPGWERTFQVTGTCGVPPGAGAMSANVTITNAQAAGELRAFPGRGPVPTASSISFRAGQTRANNLILGLSPAGEGTFTIFNATGGTVDVIVDVNGYLQ